MLINLQNDTKSTMMNAQQTEQMNTAMDNPTTTLSAKAHFEELRASADKASALMKVMANADRLMVLCQLSLGEKTVSELENTLNIQQPTLSQQLTVLRNASLVKTRREGKILFMPFQVSLPWLSCRFCIKKFASLFQNQFKDFNGHYKNKRCI